MSTVAPITDEEWLEHRAEITQELPDEIKDAELPMVMLGYQSKLLATTAVEQVTLCEKSRRIGVTWGVAADAVLTAGAQKQAKGMDVLYIGYNLDMAREFIDCCAMWAKSFMPAATAVQEFMFPDIDENGKTDKFIQAFRIRFASGFEILALTSKPRSLRGRQGYLIFDEAAFHDDLAGMMKAAMAFLIWGGKILVVSTHDGEGNPFNELIEEARAGKTPYKVVRITFDDAIADGLYKRICLVKGEEWSEEGEAEWVKKIREYYGDDAAEELDAIPSQGGGTYLPMGLVEAMSVKDIPVIRHEYDNAFAQLHENVRELQCSMWCDEVLLPILSKLHPYHETYLGGDFARVSDLSCFWPLQVLADMDRTTPFVLELRNTPFDQQRQILFYIVDRLPRFAGGALDAGGNGMYLAEVAAQKYGTDTIAQVHFNQSWYLENMPPFKAAFEDRVLTIPRDKDIIGDLRMIKRDGPVAKVPRDLRRKGMDGKFRHGDAAIAAALSYYASRLEPVGYGYTAPAKTIGGVTDGGQRFAAGENNRFKMRPDQIDESDLWTGGAY